MNLTTFNRSIIKGAEICNELGLDPAVVCPTTLKVNSEFNKVALLHNATHESIFFEGLNRRYYNFILKDFSYFQFSYTEITQDPNLVDKYDIRFAYYPNPANSYDRKPESTLDQLHIFSEFYLNGDWEFEEYSQALSELQVNIRAPIIRYDMSESQFKKVNHPKAHFHIGINNSSRMATNRIFTPELFTMFILNLFYRNEWENLSGEDFSLECRMELLKNNCENLNEQHFCGVQDGIINII